MLNMSIILIDINNLLQKFTMQYLMYHFLCKLITDLHNSINFITGLTLMHKSSVQQKKSEVRFGLGKNSWFGRFLVTVLTIV